MTRSEVAMLKVGSKIMDCLGETKVVTEISHDNMLYGLKWLHKDGTLSKGMEFQVPCHFENDTLVEY